MIVNGKNVCWASYRNLRGRHVHCRKPSGHDGACGPQGQTLRDDQRMQREAAARRDAIPVRRTIDGGRLIESSRREVIHADGTVDGMADYAIPISRRSRAIVRGLVRLGIYGRSEGEVIARFVDRALQDLIAAGVQVPRPLKPKKEEALR